MSFLTEIIRSDSVNNEFIKKFCFINNLRSKYLTICLLIVSVILTSYDILILQKVSDFKFFLINFKTDLILLVASFIFMVYIFFNQVKSYKEIKKQHKFTHGIISLFILCWSSFKTLIYLESDIQSTYFLIGSILIISIVYIFPRIILFLQISFTVLFYIIGLLMLHMPFNKVIFDVLFIALFFILAFIISIYIYGIQTKLLLKDTELSSLKENNGNSR